MRKSGYGAAALSGRRFRRERSEEVRPHPSQAVFARKSMFVSVMLRMG
jgi:hypothetical protein